MMPNGKAARRWLLWALGGVLLVDAALIYFNYRSTGAGPRAMRERVENLRLEHKQWAADVKRVAAIRERLPEVQKQCDRFFADEFLDQRSSYSTITADLTDVAKDAGLRATSLTFKQRDLEKRNAAEVDVAVAVEGDYSSLVRFLNGIERSRNFYVLESVSMAAGSGGAVKLTLQMRTYLRS